MTWLGSFMADASETLADCCYQPKKVRSLQQSSSMSNEVQDCAQPLQQSPISTTQTNWWTKLRCGDALVASWPTVQSVADFVRSFGSGAFGLQVHGSCGCARAAHNDLVQLSDKSLTHSERLKRDERPGISGIGLQSCSLNWMPWSPMGSQIIDESRWIKVSTISNIW